MLNQRMRSVEEELLIDMHLNYETDPCELKLDEMMEVEPEPEMI
ncbi:MAG: hypothetical protein E7I42_28955, partial [Pluralibacter gergoviae]|nr:hypothetical protein [Pluralibacter gergoviae]